MHISTSICVGLFSLFASSIQLSIPDSGHDDLQWNKRCKPVPGSPDWPLPTAWASLNRTLGGVLLAPLPPAAVCDPARKEVYDNSTCVSVGQSWSNSSFHANDPVSVDAPNWQDDACLPTFVYNKSSTCDVRPFPRYVVNATKPEHIATAIKFAGKTGVRLVVKNTGHDYLGRSTAPSSLSIWTHYLNELKLDSSFNPKGCPKVPSSPAITVGSGAQMGNIYAYLAKQNLTVVGGADPNVGLGGWLTGGGHSPLSGKYGLGSDNVVQLELVTPRGEIVTANECQHPDLFFAMRGGGGPTFGVLLSATLKVRRDEPLTLALLTINSTVAEASSNNNTNFYASVSRFFAELPGLSDAGLMGYAYLNRYTDLFSTTSPYNSAADSGSDPSAEKTSPQMIFAMFGWFLSTSVANATAAFNPLQTYLNTTSEFPTDPNAPLNHSLLLLPVPSWTAFYGISIGAAPGTVGTNVVMGSRLWSRGALESTTRDATLATALRTFERTGLQALLVSGPGVRNPATGTPDSAVTPAWRTAYAHVLTTLSPPFKNETRLAEDRTRMREELVPALSRVATAGANNRSAEGAYINESEEAYINESEGAYINESDQGEKEFQRLYWGTKNYARLSKIKERVDPEGVFWCEVCVGSEKWKEGEDGRVCRV